MKRIVLLLIIVGLFVLQPLAAQPAGQANLTKAVIVDLNIKNGNITYLGSHVVYGYPPDNIANVDFNVDLMKNGGTIASLGIEDPRILYSEEGAIIEDDVNFSIIVPFHEELQTVRVRSGTTNETMVSVDVKKPITDFCSQHRDDPECRAALGEAQPVTTKAPVHLFTGVIGLIIAVLFIASRRK